MPGTWLNTVHASAPREPPSTNAFRNIYALLSRENCIDLGQIRRELDGLRLRDAAPRAVRHCVRCNMNTQEFALRLTCGIYWINLEWRQPTAFDQSQLTVVTNSDIVGTA